MARGLTIIEVLVVMAIFAVISGVVIFNFRGFNDVIYLERLAHDIASQVEKAKRSAISGEGSLNFLGFCPPASTTSCKPSYGIVFDQLQNTVTYFRNLNNDSVYLLSDDGAPLEILSPQTGYSITEICLDPTTPPWPPCPLADVANDLTITFTRPFPDAVLSSTSASSISSAKVTVESPEGRTRVITISITGQVSVR